MVEERSNFIRGLADEIDDPAVYGNTEWVSVLIHGQSFMLHQVSSVTVAESSQFCSADLVISLDCKCYAINMFETSFTSVCVHLQRKMMSALILACRTNTPAQVIDEASSVSVSCRSMLTAGVDVRPSHGVRAKDACSWITPGIPDLRVIWEESRRCE